MLSAWLVLAGVVLVFFGLFTTRDYKTVAGSDPLPPTHWTVRLYATVATDDRDEPETRYNQPAPASLEPTTEIAELVK